MSFAVIESKAGFNSAAKELVDASPEFVLRLVGAVVHASAKLRTAANETIAWIRFFIWMILVPLLDLIGKFYAETWAQVKLTTGVNMNRRMFVALMAGAAVCSTSKSSTEARGESKSFDVARMLEVTRVPGVAVGGIREAGPYQLFQRFIGSEL